jgi:Putative Actinobacterial Holin-X, holin superfamily III
MQTARRDDVVEPFPAPKQDRSIASLFSDLARDFSRLFRQEIDLAKAEIGQKFGALGSGIGMVAAGGLIAWAGFLVLLAAAVIGLSEVVEPWQAAAIVGVAVLVLGGILVFVGKRRFRTDNLMPRRTIRTIKDDAEWAKEQVR